MRFNSSLQTKFLIYSSGTLLIVFIILGVFIGSRNSSDAINKAHEFTRLLAENKASEVKSVFKHHVAYIDANAQTLSNIIESTGQFSIEIAQKTVQTTIKGNNNIESAWLILSNELFNDEMLNPADWTMFVVDNSNASSVQQSDNQSNIDEYISKFGNSNSTTISDPYTNVNKRMVEVSAPIFKGSQKIGYIGYALNLEALSNSTSSSIFEGSVIAVINNSGLILAHTNSEYSGRIYSQTFSEENSTFEIEKKIANGSNFEIDAKYNGEPAFTYFSAIQISENSKPWSVMATLKVKNTIAATRKSILISSIVSIFGLILIILVIYYLTSKLINPIKKVTETLQLLSQGNLKDIQSAEIETDDELKILGENLNHVVNGLKKTESFALEIGQGKLDHEYTLLGDSDQIGKALIDMRNNLKKNIEEEEKRKEEDQHIAWATNGIAKFSEILRQDNSDMKKLGYNIMSNLVKYLNVNQGAIFVLNEEKGDDHHFELATAIAYGRDKYMQKQIRVGEGLVGRCAFEKKTIFLTQVPADYTTITSGLGDAKPASILIVPCLLNDEVYGIIELASFTPLKKFEIEFVEKLGESIASTISTVRVNLKTSILLSASQHQSEELAAQEEELRQNLEEMEATQEDLKRQMIANNEMQENLSKQNALLDSLLASLPDYIYFKDKDSKFLRISKSMTHLFGANSVDDVIGKSDFDFQTPENAKKYFEDEQNIIRSQKGITNQLQEEIMPDGRVVWNSVTKLPLLTTDGKCIGTFGISKNVTDLKNLEIEANKQAVLLDSLLDSLPDYIYFKDKDSKFLRISKSMINLFGAASVSEVIGKSDFDYHTPENAKTYYDDEQNIMQTRSGLTDHLQEEFLPDGTSVWMSITKLPLISANGDVFGTFGISKNVTALKMLELEAKKRSEELTEKDGVLHQNLEELKAVIENNTKLKEYVEQYSKMLIQLLNELPLKVFIKDDKGKFVVANNAVAQNFGKKAEEIIGLSDFDFYPKSEAQGYFDTEKAIIAKGKAEVFEEGSKDKYDGLIVRTIKKPFKIEHLGVTGLLGLQIDIEEWTKGKKA